MWNGAIGLFVGMEQFVFETRDEVVRTSNKSTFPQCHAAMLPCCRCANHSRSGLAGWPASETFLCFIFRLAGQSVASTRVRTPYMMKPLFWQGA